MNKRILVFEVYAGGELIRTERLERDIIKIGNLSTSHLQIDDPQVTGIHAVVEVSKDAIHLIDLGSTQGTKVNGERITKTELRDGDQIELGSTVVQFRVEQPEVKPVESSAAAASTARVPTGRFQRPSRGPSDRRHYSERFLSQPSQWDGTVEVAHLWRDHVMTELALKPSGRMEVILTVVLAAVGVVCWLLVSALEPPADAAGQPTAVLGFGIKLLFSVILAAIWVATLVPLVKSAFGRARQSSRVTIGPDKQSDIVVDDPAVDSARDLVAPSSDGSGYSLSLSRDMAGDIYIDSNHYTVAEAMAQARGGELEITPKTRARLQFGDNTVFVHQGTAPNLALPFATFEQHMGLYLVFSLVLHGLLLGLIFLAPPDQRALNIDLASLDEELVDIELFEEEEEPEELPELEETDEDEGDLVQLDEEEGRAGLEDAEETDGRMAIEGPEDNEVIQLSERQAQEEALEHGVLNVLQQFDGPDQLFGGTRPIGYDDVMAWGDQYGPTVGDTYGFTGLASVGPGAGGGGPPGGLGVGRISLRGRYSGDDEDADLGRGLRDMHERGEHQVEVDLGDPTIEGHLDRDVIRRVVRQHHREIRDCYQRELQRNPNLGGRIVVNFTIDPSGRVAQARVEESDMGNRDVEECLTRRIRQWQFPVPSTPGLVHVNYPFVFTGG